MSEAVSQAAGLIPALQPWLLPAFTLWGGAISWLELLACVLAVWMVLCNFRVHWLGWPLAILSSGLYGLLFIDSRLYGVAALQAVFIVVGFWGWWQWLRGTTAAGQQLPVRSLSPRQRLWAIGGTLALWPLLGLLLKYHTNSDVPFLDALPTVGSLVGQYLLGRKWRENWAVWVAVNIVSVALFATKGLWLTVALYTLFTAMAVAGWRAWGRLLPATPGAAPQHG